MRKLYLLALFFISFVVFGCAPEEEVCECYKYARDLWISYGTTNSFDSVQFFVNGSRVCNDFTNEKLGSVYNRSLCIECSNSYSDYGEKWHYCLEEYNYLNGINQCDSGLIVQNFVTSCRIDEFCHGINIDSVDVSLRIYPSQKEGEIFDEINFATPSLVGSLTYYADIFKKNETYPMFGWNKSDGKMLDSLCSDKYCYVIDVNLENDNCVHGSCALSGEFDCRENLNF